MAGSPTAPPPHPPLKYLLVKALSGKYTGGICDVHGGIWMYTVLMYTASWCGVEGGRAWYTQKRCNGVHSCLMQFQQVVVYCKGWMYTEMQDVHKEMCDSCNFVCGVLQQNGGDVRCIH